MDDYKKDWEIIENNLKGKRKQERYKRLSKEQLKNESEYDKIQNGYFDLLKNCTILSGTIFASSIALASGRDVNSLFIIGELFLLISTLVGAMYLWSQMKGRETSYFLMTAWQMEGDLITNKDIMENFEKEQTESIVKEYKRLANKKSILYHFLKLVKIDWLPTIFFTSLFLGLILVWLSLFYNETTSNIHNIVPSHKYGRLH